MIPTNRSEFVHLHLHSEYSLLDGASRVKALAARAAELGMPAMAMTDHGAMYGALEFYQACRENGVKPVLGCELYVAPRSRFDKTARVDDEPYHFVMLAKDREGWSNLTKLVSSGFLEGFYYKPRVDRELLAEHSKGLIALSACLGAEVPQLLLKEQLQQAEEAAAFYRDVFGPDGFYLELQDHGIPEQRRVNRALVEMSRRLGVGLVATNDAHYLRRDDAGAHDVLLCIQTAANVDSPKRLKFPTEEFYVKTQDEMARLFGELPESLSNTLEIAERCNLEFEFGQLHLPRYELPEGFDAGSYLRKLCYDRLSVHYPGDPPEVRRRLDYELDMIIRMGYAGYFLIVWDFIDFARRSGIPVGPGRGSAAGSMVAYVLGITNIDPLRYGLVFERFLNPERVDMPDIDIDFCYERRDEVIRYVAEKYGADCVAQIITFGTMGAKAVIRDVGRAMGLTYGDVDRIAKLVPTQLHMTLDKAIETEPELRRAYEESDVVRRLIDVAKRLEGLPRHPSVHAAGVVIAHEPLVDIVPLARTQDGNVVTQFNMDLLKEIGLLKMDFLGLRTLTVLQDTLENIRRTAGETLDLDGLPLDDEPTYAMLCEAQTSGVFQLESGGMRDMLRELRPSNIEDVIAAVALFRPGPMENIPAFVKAKHSGRRRYPHPDLEPVLQDSYGVMIYQEQIMRTVSVMAGFSLGEADMLRRAMGKKKKEIMDEYRERFVRGCLEHGHDEKLAMELYDLIEKFAGYGFNKSHAAAYGVVAYQTAYLKANYPVQYMAALLTSVMGDSTKVAEYIAECRRLGVDVLAPDVNESDAAFTVVGVSPEAGEAAGRPAGAATGAAAEAARGTVAGAAQAATATATAAATGDAAAAATGDATDTAPATVPAAATGDATDAAPATVPGPATGAPSQPGAPPPARPRRRTPSGKVRFGLAAVKNVGLGAIESIVRSRQAQGPCASLAEFLGRVDLRQCNRRALESLIKAGAFDSLGTRRAQLAAGLDACLDAAQSEQKLRAAGQLSLFSEPVADELPDVPEYPQRQVLAMEKEVLGIYVTGHPLEAVGHLLAGTTLPVSELAERADDDRVTVGGMIATVKRTVTRKGDSMAFLTLEDLVAQVEVVVFPAVFSSNRALLEPDALVRVRGKVSWRDEQVTLVAEEVLPLLPSGGAGGGLAPVAGASLDEALCIRLPRDCDRPALEMVRAAVRAHPGPCPVYLYMERERRWIRAGGHLGVTPDDELVRAVEEVVGAGGVRVRALAAR